MFVLLRGEQMLVLQAPKCHHVAIRALAFGPIPALNLQLLRGRSINNGGPVAPPL